GPETRSATASRLAARRPRPARRGDPPGLAPGRYVAPSWVLPQFFVGRLEPRLDLGVALPPRRGFSLSAAGRPTPSGANLLAGVDRGRAGSGAATVPPAAPSRGGRAPAEP